MRAISSVLAVCLFIGSAALGLFFLGSAGLSAGASAMSVAWSAWTVGSVASALGLFFAVRRLFLPAVLGLTAVPFALALLAANLALRFGQ